MEQKRQNRRVTSSPLALGFLLIAAPVFAAKVSVTVRDKYGNPAVDAVVYVIEATPGAHAAPDKPYIMDQIKQEFVPHVVPIQVGGKVSFPNQDNVHHHLFSFSEAKKFEIPLQKGKPADPVEFEKAGIVKVGCNIHDWMNGIILVLPNPYFAKTNAKGLAELELPDGELAELEVFHERLRGDIAATRQKIKLAEGAKAEFKLPLKMANRKKRPVTFSNY